MILKEFLILMKINSSIDSFEITDAGCFNCFFQFCHFS